MCFNLFGELCYDFPLASKTLAPLTRGTLSEVVSVEFEWSPGRGDSKYTDDQSAFDVYIRYRTADKGTGFLGIEVKYHEDLSSSKQYHRNRHDEVARQMNCFRSDALPLLRQPGKLQQMWRDHLLVGAHRIVDKFDEAHWVFLYPEANTACSEAVIEYRNSLSDET